MHSTGHQVAVVHDLAKGSSGPDRPGEPAQLVEPGVIRHHVGDQGFEAHGCGDLGLAQPTVDVPQRQGAHRGQDVRAVDRRQPVTGLETRGRDAGPFHGFSTGQPLALVPGLALAHEEQCRLGHRAPGRRSRPRSRAGRPPA